MAKRKAKKALGLSNGKSWAIFDRIEFRRLCAIGRAKGDLPRHDGECLRRLTIPVRHHLVQVADAHGAVSEKQARLFGANGGLAKGLPRSRRRNGAEFRSFADTSRYMAVEKAVIEELYLRERFDWENLGAVRQDLFDRHGESFLANLCQNFRPDRTPWQAKREPGSDGSENGPFDLPGMFDPLEFPLPDAKKKARSRPRRRNCADQLDLLPW